MKTAIQLVITLFFVINIYAQQAGLSAGKAPFNKAKSHVQYGISSLASEAFANDNSTSSNISIPIPDGTPFTTLGTFAGPVFAASMCKGGDGNYYLVDVGPPPGLYLFDPASGTCTWIENISGMGSDPPNGLSYDPVNDSYYIVSPANLYSFDINTYIATLVGAFSPVITGSMIDLCFDENGTCYAYELNVIPGAANAYTIDINTAALTTLGYVGFTPNFGQGMSYDFETGTIYLAAFNYDLGEGELRTMDKTTGNTTLVYVWGDQIAPFALNSIPGPPCPVAAASNPNPPSGTTEIIVDGITLAWDNGAGTTNTEVWFGPTGNVIQVYSGPLITSWDTGPLQYFTTYHWYVKDNNDTCGTTGPNWNFRTEQNPYLMGSDFYPMSAQYWTGTTEGTAKTDGTINTEYPNLGWAVYDISSISPYTFIDSIRFFGYVNSTNWPYWSATPMGDVNPVTDNTASIYNQVSNNAGQSDAYIYSDEASTFTTGWHTYAMENSALSDLQGAINSGRGWFAMGFIDRDGTNTYFIDFDGWSDANPPYIEITYYCLSCYPPNPPGNLTAQEIFNSGPQVQLNWQDNSYDEYGFNIYRKDGDPGDPTILQLIGEVSSNIVLFIDSTVILDSTYSYAVTAYNNYGSSSRSNFATITISATPVELTSFRVNVNDGSVYLDWQTATETNNKGFEIQRNSGNGYEVIAFINGNGTTTELHNYSFVDKPSSSGKYTYRLRQVDFNGSSEYSNEIELQLDLPKIYSLEQNYPNPFNPTTQIKFSLAEDSKVTLKVFDILGREVATILKGNLTAGGHTVTFKASKLPSGVYIYKLEASGVDGSNFTSVKKMVLMK